jgi:histidinol-phosphate phosphatase family protein
MSSHADMQAVILAGGVGSRLGDAARGLPKAMVPIAGRPMIEHQLAWIAREGLRDVIVLTGHLGEQIERFVGDGSRWGLRVRCRREPAPLGTAGAVRAAADELRGDFLVLYADTVFDLDLPALRAFHDARRGLATLVAHPNDHPHDSDLLDIDGEDRITAVYRKPRANPARWYRNLVSAAMYIMSPKLLDSIPPGTFADFGRDVFPRLVEGGVPLHAYRTREYIKDVGTPARLREVEHDLLAGRVAAFNRRHTLPAVFLDRDGVLNDDACGDVTCVDDMRLLPGAAEAVRLVNRSGRLAVVVTNQPMIAKGFASLDDLALVHAKLESDLGAAGAYADRIYFSPYHPEAGHPGERAQYKRESDCRKPGTGMITRAAAELNIDLPRSFIIGDRTTDIECGRRAGIGTVLVRTGAGGGDGKFDVEPDRVCDDVLAAVTFILNENSTTAEQQSSRC